MKKEMSQLHHRKMVFRLILKNWWMSLCCRDVSAPILVRFPDILDNRIEKHVELF